MLLDNFFTITDITISQTKDEAIIKVKLNPNHNIFDGHFPGTPIVPGVCFIQMIKEILTKIVNADLILISSKNIKFQNLVNPLNLNSTN
jgi:3-hydroxyacyl-[acyl-carrier-protein] dehydratase